jgi:hypothetical protein
MTRKGENTPNLILPVVLYVSGTWSVAVRSNRSMMFQNSVHRRMFGQKMAEVATGCKRTAS